MKKYSATANLVRMSAKGVYVFFSQRLLHLRLALSLLLQKSRSLQWRA